MTAARNYLIYAILLGGLAAAGAAWYVNNAEAAANPTESVVVARTSIPARVVLTEDFLTVKRVPKGAVHPDAATSMEPFIGRSTKQSVAVGEQILASKLFRDRKESGAAFVLPSGHRAVAMNVNELIAAGGLILPGDKVDVIGSCLVTQRPTDTNAPAASAPPNSPAPEVSQIARVVYSLQKLEVMAVAQDIVGEEALGAQNTLRAQDSRSALDITRQAEIKPGARTVTLALSPEESQKLILLENHPACRIRLALRGAGDSSMVGTGVLDFDPVASMETIVKR